MKKKNYKRKIKKVRKTQCHCWDNVVYRMVKWDKEKGVVCNKCGTPTGTGVALGGIGV